MAMNRNARRSLASSTSPRLISGAGQYRVEDPQLGGSRPGTPTREVLAELPPWQRSRRRSGSPRTAGNVVRASARRSVGPTEPDRISNNLASP
jgi:hypothetical protein